jgi:hypothetical protein
LPESKDNAQNGRKILTSYSPDKRLISRTHKELKTLNSKRINNPISKWENEQIVLCGEQST